MKRVVITGMGTVNPLGDNVEKFWNSALEGKVGIDFITAFDTEDLDVKLAAEIKDFDPSAVIDRKEAKRMDRYNQLAVVAADEAIKDANLDIENIDSERLGVIVSSGIGGLQSLEKEHASMLKRGPKRVSPFMIPMMIGNIAAGTIAIRYNAKSTCLNVVTACASATHSIGEGYKSILCDESDVMIVGGAEGSITKLSIAGFQNMTALTTSTDPMKASTPFDKNRSGFVMGEGAGILIIESLEHAQKRGAKIYAELVGYGSTCDAYHITAPAESGDGPKRSMELAIKRAGAKVEDIDYINCHGTSTPFNDKTECTAIKTLFGDHAKNLKINSTKSMVGHLLGASGGVEAIAAIKSIETGKIHPTMGYETPDENCDLDCVPLKAIDHEVNYALSNSLGFGGHNGSLLFKKFEV